jgi:hypothetical protein
MTVRTTRYLTQLCTHDLVFAARDNAGEAQLLTHGGLDVVEEVRAGLLGRRAVDEED